MAYSTLVKAKCGEKKVPSKKNSSCCSSKNIKDFAKHEIIWGKGYSVNSLKCKYQQYTSGYQLKDKKIYH